MPGCVARAVAHRQAAAAHQYRVAIGQPAGWDEGLGRRKAEHAGLLRQAVNPELVTGVRADDGQAQCARQAARAARMVDMGSRDQPKCSGHLSNLARAAQQVNRTTNSRFSVSWSPGHAE